MMTKSIGEETIHRVPRERDFVVIPNEVVFDKRLSWAARGLLCYLLAKPNDWKIRRADLVKQSPASETVVRRLLKELRMTGYLHRQRAREKGRFIYHTHVYERPKDNPAVQAVFEMLRAMTTRTAGLKPTSGKPTSGSSASGKTDSGEPYHIQSTESQSTESLKEKEEAPPAHSQKGNVSPAPAPEPPPTDPIAQELVILDLYRDSITPLPCRLEIDHIVSDITDLSQAGYNALDVFRYAITQAVGANARKLNYIQAIVKNIRDSKMPLAAYIEKRQAKTKRNGGSNGNQRQTSIPGLRREDSAVEKRANIATGETYYVSRATGERVPAPA